MTSNLGLIQAIKVGVAAPTNTLQLWYDDNPGQKIHKYYDTVFAAWLPLNGASTLPTINNVGDSISSLDGLTWTAQDYFVDRSSINSLDYYQRSLYDTFGVVVASWDTLVLYDSLSLGSVFWGSRELRDSLGTTKVDWGSGVLGDSSGFNSVDWENRLLYDNLGIYSVAWQDRILKDTLGSFAADWSSRTLINTATTTSIDWENNQLYDYSANMSVDWESRYLKTSAGSYAMDWENRVLYDGSSAQSIDFGLRRAYDTGADSVFSWVTEFRTHRLNGTNNSYASNKRSYKHEYQASVWDGVVANDKFWKVWHEVSLAADKSWLQFNDSNSAEAIRFEDGGDIVMQGLLRMENSSTTAPALVGAAPTFTDYYGGNTNALGDPDGWAIIYVNGVSKKFPYYDI